MDFLMENSGSVKRWWILEYRLYEMEERKFDDTAAY